MCSCSFALDSSFGGTWLTPVDTVTQSAMMQSTYTGSLHGTNQNICDIFFSIHLLLLITACKAF